MYLAREQLAKAQLADTELETALGAQLTREDVPWDITVADGETLGCLALAATLSDLVIVSLGARDRRGLAQGAIAGDLAMTVPEIGRAHVDIPSLMRISYAVFCLKK